MKAKSKVKLRYRQDQLVAADVHWLTLGELRDLVREADAHGWTDSCLVSHSDGGKDHPNLRHMRTATYLVVEGPA